jgi:hypothetical protein
VKLQGTGGFSPSWFIIPEGPKAAPGTLSPNIAARHSFDKNLSRKKVPGTFCVAPKQEVPKRPALSPQTSLPGILSQNIDAQHSLPKHRRPALSFDKNLSRKKVPGTIAWQ